MSNTTSSNPASLRIANLLDEGSFVEIGGQVTARTTDFNMQEKKAPTDGVITGYGVIDGNLVYVYSQDASVLNGTIGERIFTFFYFRNRCFFNSEPITEFFKCKTEGLSHFLDTLILRHIASPPLFFSSISR